MFPFLLLYTLVARLITCDSSMLILFGKSIDTSIGFFFPLYGISFRFHSFSSFYTINLILRIKNTTKIKKIARSC